MARLFALFRLTLFLALVGVCGIAFATPPGEPAHRASIGVVKAAALPREAQHTLLLIRQGGPFPYPNKDGSIFGNFEQRLPLRARGYYREYTVPTPGRTDRGARRIVAGKGENNSVATSGEYYYTGNHYRTFHRIQEQ